MHPSSSVARRITHTDLQRRLDQLRVKIHLGGMDARDKFEAISHEVAALQRTTTRTSKEAARRLLDRIIELESILTHPISFGDVP